MIQANELRIGNSVNYKWFEKKYNPKKTIIHREYVEILAIDSINKRVLIKPNQTRRNHTWVSLEKIIRIPLTEEILLKCGFEKDNITRDYCFNVNDVENRSNFDDGWLILYDDLGYSSNIKKLKLSIGDYRNCVLSKDINYLHELQNIMQSCLDIDLEINL